MTDLVTKLRITGDASGLKSAAKEAADSNDALGNSAGATQRKLDGMNAAVDAASRRLDNFAKTGQSAGDGLGVLGDQSNRAVQELGRASEATGRMSAAEDLLAQGTRDVREGFLGATGAARPYVAILLGAGAVLTTLVGILGGFAIALLAGWREQKEFENALTASGDAAGVTESRLHAMSEEVGAATGEYDKARASLLALTLGGKVTGDALADSARAAVALSEITGESIASTTAKIEQLAESPVQGIVRLNDQYHFLTLTIYDQIKALDEAGRTNEAAELAASVAANALDDRRAKIVENAGLIEKAWKAAGDEVQTFWQRLKDIGRTDTQSQLASLYAEQFDNEAQLASAKKDTLFNRLFQPESAVADYQAALDHTNAKIAALQREAQAEEDVADAQAKQQRIQDDAVGAAAAIDAQALRVDRVAAKQKELNDLTANYAKLWADPNRADDPRLAGVTRADDGSFSGGQFDQQQAAIIKRYAERATGAATAAKAQRELEQADRAQTSALRSLDDATDNAQAKLSKETAAWDHYTDAIEKIAIQGGKAVAASQKLGTAGTSVATIQDKVNKALAASFKAYEKEIAAIVLKSEKLKEVPYVKLQNDLANYQESQVAEIELLQAQSDAHGELSELQKAELFIRQRMASASELNRKRLEEENKVIREQAKELDQLHAKQGLTDALKTSFGDITTQVQNGTSVWTAFGQVAEKSLGGIATQFGKIITAQRDAESGTVDWSKAVEQMGAAVKDALPALGLMAGAIIASTGENAAAGAAIGTAIGVALGSTVLAAYGGPAVWGAIGGAVGGAIGSAFDHDRKPSFRIGAGAGVVEASTQGNLGSIDVGSVANYTGVSNQRIAETVRDFDNLIASILPEQLLGRVTQVLSGWSAQASSLDELMAQRFEAILGALDANVGNFVRNFSSDLQTRVQALADVLQLQRLADSDNLVVGSLDDALGLVTKFAQPGERVLATYQRIAQAALDFDQALAVTGVIMNHLGERSQYTRLEMVDLAASIAKAAGSAERAHALWQNFFDNFSRGTGTVIAAYERGQKEFDDIGRNMQDFMGPGGAETFAQEFAKVLASGDAELITQWLEAAQALSDVNDQIMAFGKAQSDYASFISDLGQQGAGISTVSPLAAQRLAIEQWEQETIKRANDLARAAGLQSAAEQDLILIREIAAHRLEEAMAAIEDSSRDLASQLWGNAGATSDAADTASTAIGRFGHAMTSAAQAAQSAAQLLLGELSPLNDQQKLQYALDAYQRGLVDKEDVLQVGRRLYGSSLPYQQLFDLLQHLPGGRPQSTGGGLEASGAYGSTADNQTDPQNTAASRNAQAQQLAQNVASLAYAYEQQGKGKTYDQIAEGLGFNLQQLAGELGLSQAELTDYLDTLKAQETAVPDSIGDSADRIIAALYDIAGREPPPPNTGIPVRDQGPAPPRDRRPPGRNSGRPDAVDPFADDDNHEYGRGGRDRGHTSPYVNFRPKDVEQINTSLNDVRGLLSRVLDATNAGSHRVVEAVHVTTDAVRGVDTSIQRGSADAAANRARNSRSYAP